MALYGHVRLGTVWYGFDTIRYATATLKEACGYSISFRKQKSHDTSLKNIANIKLGMIKHAFNYLINEDSFKLLYKSMVRPHLKYTET